MNKEKEPPLKMNSKMTSNSPSEVGSYYIEKRLKAQWDNIKATLIKHDQDRAYIVDGREGVGKSLWTLQQAAYLDPSIIHDISRVCFTPEEFLSAIRRADKGQVVIFDEAFRGLSSRAALSKVNKKIIQAMMEMRQNNLIVFIVLPSFFLLDIYPAILRSSALFHISKERLNNNRYFTAYNFKKKGVLYQRGVKYGWTYKEKSNFRGRFFNIYPGGDEFEKLYRAKKRQALLDFDKEVVKKEVLDKRTMARDLVILEFIKTGKFTQKSMSEWFIARGIPMSPDLVGVALRKATEHLEGLQKPIGESILNNDIILEVNRSGTERKENALQNK